MCSGQTDSNLKSELLVFVVGASGSGKDTVMSKTVKNLRLEQIPIKILQRYITRPSDATEESVYVSKKEFLQKKSENQFALSWFIYNNWYGCPRELLDQSLDRGEIVLVNVSRSVLHEARKQYPESKIIYIDVHTSVAESRIKARGREVSNQLNERLTRIHESIDMPIPDKTIHNDEDVESAVQELTDYLKKIYLEAGLKKLPAENAENNFRVD
ncbi:MAG: hypothetical protein ACFE9A_19510 [Candidatus Hodarchaeota archaeon]